MHQVRRGHFVVTNPSAWTCPVLNWSLVYVPLFPMTTTTPVMNLRSPSVRTDSVLSLSPVKMVAHASGSASVSEKSGVVTSSNAISEGS